MARPEASIQSFVLRIWLDTNDDEVQTDGGHPIWRGHITDVASGERCYVDDLDEIASFLVPRLERMGVRIGLRWRMRRWLRRHGTNALKVDKPQGGHP
jgi:hypothetical protein